MGGIEPVVERHQGCICPFRHGYVDRVVWCNGVAQFPDTVEEPDVWVTDDVCEPQSAENMWALVGAGYALGCEPS